MLFVYVCVWDGGCGVWVRVGRPCLPIRNDIVNPQHLLDASSHPYERVCPLMRNAKISENSENF